MIELVVKLDISVKKDSLLILFQAIADRLSKLKGDVIASVPMTDFIKGYQTHKYLLPK